MTTFLIFLAIVLLVLILGRLKTISDSISAIKGEQYHVENKLIELVKTQQKTLEAISRLAEGSTPTGDEPEEAVLQTVQPSPPTIVPEIYEEPETLTPPLSPLVAPADKEVFSPQPVASFMDDDRIGRKSWYSRFKEKNPDLERFIGENIINKIGILILVLGVSFFVKYAIDKNWISEPLRAGIGILIGSGILVIANRLRIDYKAFSSVLVAGAISIYYFTIAIAFHDYHLFSQTTAFVIMVLITIVSVGISVGYNRQELAIMSLIGGFGVPFMVSTDSGNPVVLFSYILILNAGVLIIAHQKKWTLTTLLAFLFTAILVSGWFFVEGVEKELFQLTLTYATIYYFLFSIVSIAGNLREKGQVTYLQHTLIVLNTAFYYSIGYIAVHHLEPRLVGLFTLSLALYNLLFAYILFRKQVLDRNSVYLLVGLALSFATLTIPLQFSGHYITLFWAAEAVLLIWLAEKSGIQKFGIVAIVVQFLMLGSLTMDWSYDYGAGEPALPVIVNPVFVTTIVSLVSLILSYRILKSEKRLFRIWKISVDPLRYRHFLLIMAVIAGYVGGILEVIYQSNRLLSNEASAWSLVLLYHILYFFSFYMASNSLSGKLKRYLLALNILNVVIFLLANSYVPYREIFYNVRDNTTYSIAFFTHYISLAAVSVVLFAYVRNVILKKTSSASTRSMWIAAFAIVYLLSNELMMLVYYYNRTMIPFSTLEADFPSNALMSSWRRMSYIKLQFSKLGDQVVKIGFPILWGCISFFFLIVGIRSGNRPARIAALTLLAITIFKLFVFDIRNVSETGKIIAFILLGVLILVISFVYQKIRKLMTGDQDSKQVADEPDN